MMKRTQKAPSRFGDSSLQWQQVVLLLSATSSQSQKIKSGGGIQVTGKAKKKKWLRNPPDGKRSSQARIAEWTGARLLTMTIWYGARAATQAS
jgi:hypothetical protein